LRPSLLDDLGLIDAIDWLASDLQKRSKIEISMKIIGEPGRLPSRDELLIFRIVQEALHNVERHSGATHVGVWLLFNANTLSITISDNGCGLSPHGPPTETGLGLRGIDERTKLLKGMVTIESQPNRGTKITLEVPRD
jgi:signal transduction histidine kinase